MSADPISSTYAGRVVVAVAIVALAWLAWRLLPVAILVFGGVLVAAALHALAAPLRERLRWPPQAALAAVVAGLAVIVGLGGWALGDRLGEQLAELRQTLPRALDQAMRWLQAQPVGSALLELWDNARSDTSLLPRLTRVATTTLGALGSALLIIVAGIYFAADPALYRRGLLHLLPPAHRASVEAALLAAGEGLTRWLLGQLLSMGIIGTLTAIGLFAIGMPLAGTLGVITGALAFVPFFGAVASGVLVVLLAFTQGPGQALQAALLYVAVQQVEGHALLPLVNRWSVRLPPVLGLVAVLIFGALMGPLGALFATPLMVVVMILVQRLYVRGVTEAAR